MSVERDRRGGDTCHRVNFWGQGPGSGGRRQHICPGGGGAVAAGSRRGELRGWVCGLPVGGGRPAVRGKGDGEGGAVAVQRAGRPASAGLTGRLRASDGGCPLIDRGVLCLSLGLVSGSRQLPEWRVWLV